MDKRKVITVKETEMGRIAAMASKLEVPVTSIENYLSHKKWKRLGKIRGAYERYRDNCASEDDIELLTHLYINSSITSSAGELWIVALSSEIWQEELPDPDRVERLHEDLKEIARDELANYQEEI